MSPVSEETSLPIEEKNGRLVFLNFDAYEKLISKPADIREKIKTISRFTSMHQAWTFGLNAGRVKESPIPVTNERLATILNEDGVMQVGKWIIRVNTNDSVVTVLDSKWESQHYKNLIKDVKIPEIYRFSTNDEVLTLLEEGATSSPEKKSSGRTKLCLSFTSLPRINLVSSPIPLPPMQAYGVHTYEPYGVYFEATAYLGYAGGLLLPPDTRSGTYSISYSWQQTCNRGSGGENLFLIPFTLTHNPAAVTLQWRATKFLYSGSRQLKNLYIASEFYIDSWTAVAPVVNR